MLLPWVSTNGSNIVFGDDRHVLLRSFRHAVKVCVFPRPSVWVNGCNHSSATTCAWGLLWCFRCAAVSSHVTLAAESDAVGDFQSQFRMRGVWLFMVSGQPLLVFFALLAAVPTNVSVSFQNGVAPCNVGGIFEPLPWPATFPVRVIFPLGMAIVQGLRCFDLLLGFARHDAPLGFLGYLPPSFFRQRVAGLNLSAKGRQVLMAFLQASPSSPFLDCDF